MEAVAETREVNLNIGRMRGGLTVEQAVGELIANALDEAAHDEPGKVTVEKAPDGSWRIRDWGRGIHDSHLLQKTDPEKVWYADEVIGRKGVKLKEALATFCFKRVAVVVRSRYCVLEPEMAPMHDREAEKTVRVVVRPPEDRDMVGTEVVLRNIQDLVVKAAREQFLILNGEQLLEKTESGQVFQRMPGRPARVYVQGTKVADDRNLLFSYNITSPPPAMERARGKGPGTLTRAEYASGVKAILLEAKSEAVTGELARDLGSADNRDEVKKWQEVAIHVCRQVSLSSKAVFLRGDEDLRERRWVERAEGDGYKCYVVPDDVWSKLGETVDDRVRPVRTLHVYQDEWMARFSHREVLEASLTEAERAVLARCHALADLVGGIPKRVKGVSVVEEVRPERVEGKVLEPALAWDPAEGQIRVARRTLADEARFSGEYLRALLKARSDKALSPRELEDALVEVLGRVVSGIRLDESNPT